mmetsp:Transcript_46980/g.147224  ORF Transcript_46980/g.147224 Transcript_46980/m.147224 type:complete len:268 (+) Transcript_46980:1204-2007(+)
MHLRVRLVHEDDRPEGRVVGPAASPAGVRLHEEALRQEPGVLLLHLAEAVQVGVEAVPGHLQVEVAADAGDDVQALLPSLVEELRVVHGGVRAVKPHGIGAQPAHDPEIPASHGALAGALLAPEDLGALRHEVLATGRLKTRGLRRQRVVADGLDDVPLVRRPDPLVGSESARRADSAASTPQRRKGRHEKLWQGQRENPCHDGGVCGRRGSRLGQGRGGRERGRGARGRGDRGRGARARLRLRDGRPAGRARGGGCRGRHGGCGAC